MNKKLIFIAILLVLVGVIGFRLATNNPSKNITQAVNANNLRHVAIKIDGMHCASCPYNVENALKDAPGVVNVTVGFVGKEIVNGTVEGRGEVVYDATQTNHDKMVQVILPYKGAVMTSFALLFTLSAIGISETIYLIRKRIVSEKPICPIGEGCVAVLTSKYSKIFIIPNDVLGLLSYIVISFIAAFLVIGIQPMFLWNFVLKILVAVASLMSIFLTYLQWRIIHAWCFWYLMSAFTI